MAANSWKFARKQTLLSSRLKSGVSAHGAAAAASHTGSLAGSGKVYDAAFQQAGVVRASDLNNLFDRTLALSLQPPMKGENILSPHQWRWCRCIGNRCG